MVRVWLLAASAGIVATSAGGGLAAEAQWWRPAMPVVRIDVREAGVPTPTLVLVYGEGGGDPFRSGSLAGDEIASCRTLAGVCTSGPSHNAFHLSSSGRQSVQIRWLNGDGKPTIGAVMWEGRGHPRQVDLRCDLGATDPHAACSIVRVVDE